MDKATLMIIADIVNSLERSNREVYEMLDILNITDEEKETIMDSVTVIAEKLAQMRRSNINELDNYIDVNYVKTTNRY